MAMRVLRYTGENNISAGNSRIPSGFIVFFVPVASSWLRMRYSSLHNIRIHLIQKEVGWFETWNRQEAVFYLFPASDNIHPVIKSFPIASITETSITVRFLCRVIHYKRKAGLLAAGQEGAKSIARPPLWVKDTVVLETCLKVLVLLKGLACNGKKSNCFLQNSWSKIHNRQNSTLKASVPRGIPWLKKKKKNVRETNINYTHRE